MASEEVASTICLAFHMTRTEEGSSSAFFPGIRVGAPSTTTVPCPAGTGKYEITFDEWDACVAAKLCAQVKDDGWGRERRPVIYVNLDMAVGYAKWLSEKTGKKYHLPSEAEWEYAARGGSKTPWFWGTASKDACTFANVGDQSVKGEHPDWTIHDCNDGYAKTAPVGSFEPNALGLYDTAGNAWEWVEDCLRPNLGCLLFPQGDQSNPTRWKRQLGGPRERSDAHRRERGRSARGPKCLSSRVRLQ